MGEKRREDVTVVRKILNCASTVHGVHPARMDGVVEAAPNFLLPERWKVDFLLHGNSHVAPFWYTGFSGGGFVCF